MEVKQSLKKQACCLQGASAPLSAQPGSSNALVCIHEHTFTCTTHDQIADMWSAGTLTALSGTV